jgi:hypothetical protein
VVVSTVHVESALGAPPGEVGPVLAESILALAAELAAASARVSFKPCCK